MYSSPDVYSNQALNEVILLAKGQLTNLGGDWKKVLDWNRTGVGNHCSSRTSQVLLDLGSGFKGKGAWEWTCKKVLKMMKKSAQYTEL